MIDVGDLNWLVDLVYMEFYYYIIHAVMNGLHLQPPHICRLAGYNIHQQMGVLGVWVSEGVITQT